MLNLIFDIAQHCAERLFLHKVQKCYIVSPFSNPIFSLVVLLICNYLYVVLQSSDKFCENRSLCDKSAKFCITKEYSVISDFKMGTT